MTIATLPHVASSCQVKPDQYSNNAFVAFDYDRTRGKYSISKMIYSNMKILIDQRKSL